MNQTKYRIGKVHISVTNPVDAQQRITQAALEVKGGYVCVSNMRTVVYANKHDDYREVMDNAFMCLPDGMPLVWMARLWGKKDVKRTDGPNLFVSMLNNGDSGIKHFLLGDTDENLAAMREKYCNANIVGCYSPPFCGLDEYDYEGIAKQINESGADVVWVSLRAPKQDFFAARIRPYLQGKMCVGVGAAFRFALGEIQHPNKVVQKLGLTGLVWRKNKVRTLWDNMVRFLHLCLYSVQIIFARLNGKN
ncbi:MAG: WecB/TagA/CpsF family glycosyltransferase [Salinivirgaceae bacterium]|nr:WecB/TagA/CpsF family glycosyltransferase [Salinivirgaceae bacterium]